MTTTAIPTTTMMTVMLVMAIAMFMPMMKMALPINAVVAVITTAMRMAMETTIMCV